MKTSCPDSHEEAIKKWRKKTEKLTRNSVRNSKIFGKRQEYQTISETFNIEALKFKQQEC